MKKAMHGSLMAVRLAILLGLALLVSPTSSAQVYKILHAFTGGADGGSPLYVKLLRDAKGNFNGTTQVGGAHGFGTVFRMDPRGNETVLYSFTGGFDGAQPQAGLVTDAAGNLYGTAKLGGAPCFEGQGGCGVVFELTASGEYILLHSFLGVIGGGDGGFPASALLRDAHGNLFGTTAGGGINTAECQEGAGTVFEMTAANGSWTELLLYSFPCTDADGMFPYSPLVLDRSGTLYGTTTGGGTCGGADIGRCGTAFQLKPGANWTHSTIHGFGGGSDGAALQDGLVRDTAGNLYGTTQLGGAFGFGTIFRIDASGDKTILHSFTGTDGAYPVGGLARDKAGNLYGTTQQGGSSQVGTVFEFDAAGTLTVLHTFTGGNDGAYPAGTLLRSGGVLFGTTSAGGPYNMGIVFKLKP